MSYTIVDQLSVTGKRVFLRVDFNIPRDKSDSSKILDDTRIREALPTIRYLLDQKAKVILASHLGRPKGKEAKYSLEPVAQRLSELLGHDVIFPEDCVGDAVKKLALELKDGEVLLLENLRFHPEEEANDPHFSQALAQLAQIYISDAFGVLHRAHASTAGMVSHFSEKGIGFLVAKEVNALEKLIKNSAKPFYAVLGGAKVSDKIGLIENLIPKVDGVLLGGGLVYTFLKAQGIEVGNSLVEMDKLHLAERIFEKAKNYNIPIYLPTDHVIAPKIADNVQTRTLTKVPHDQMGLDIGPTTRTHYKDILRKAKTVFWNGPMGVFEIPAFSEGTLAIARAIADSGAESVVGGGESVAAVQKSGVADKITHLSTGGGATLEYLEGRELPGLKVLEV